MKLCIDCKYHSCFTQYCQHESNKTETDPVLGRHSYEWSYGYCRKDEEFMILKGLNLCNLEAKYWTPSLWYRFRKFLRTV